jgi:HEAT repeat protein
MLSLRRPSAFVRSAVAATALVGALLSTQPAHAAPPDLAQVRELLSGYEGGPAESTWRALGPETLGVLITLYDAQGEAPFVRQRAVAAAAYYPSPAARTFLRAVLVTPGQSDLFIRTAVDALARAFGAAAWDEVQPYLAHPAVTVRMGAVRAAVRIGTPAARNALRARLRAEQDAEVREALSAALAR